MDITYGCMDVWLWLKFMTESVDIIDYAGINPYVIVEFADYVHAYIFNEATQEVCHISGHTKG